MTRVRFTDIKYRRRQYVHRLGKIWHITKYNTKGGPGPAKVKRPSPKSPSPTGGGENSVSGAKPSRIIVGKRHEDLAVQPGGPWLQKPSSSPQPSFAGRDSYSRGSLRPPGPLTPEALPPSPILLDNELEPEPYHSHLESAENREKQRILAETLLALGDPHYAFTIWVALYGVEPRKEYIINALRSVQSATQAKKAQAMIDAHLSQLRVEGEDYWLDKEDSWDRFLFDMFAARTYDWGVYIGMGFRQIEYAILKRVIPDQEGRESLKVLSSRGPAFDVPALQFLSFALERYNEPAGEDEEFIDVVEVLRQFLEQQPAFLELEENTDPLLAINSLPECLDWCISVLESRLQVPTPLYNPENKTTKFYQLLHTLWNALHSDPSSPKPAWTHKTDSQFAISPTELLSTIAGMIIVFSELGTSPLESAKSLRSLRGRDLIGRFQDRIYASTIELMNREEQETTPSPSPSPALMYGTSSAPGIFQPAGTTTVTVELLNPLRESIYKALQISDDASLPELKEETSEIVCHLIAERFPSGPGKWNQNQSASGGDELRRRRSRRKSKGKGSLGSGSASILSRSSGTAGVSDEDEGGGAEVGGDRMDIDGEGDRETRLPMFD